MENSTQVQEMFQVGLNRARQCLELPNHLKERAHSCGSADMSIFTRKEEFQACLDSLERTAKELDLHRINEYQEETWKYASKTMERNFHDISSWASHSRTRDSRFQLLRNAAASVPGLEIDEGNTTLGDEMEEHDSLFVFSPYLLVEISKPPRQITVITIVTTSTGEIISRLEPESRELETALNDDDLERCKFILRAMLRRANTILRLRNLQLPEPINSTEFGWGAKGKELDIFTPEEFSLLNLNKDNVIRSWLNFEVENDQVKFVLGIRPEIAIPTTITRRVTKGDFSSNEVKPNEVQEIGKTLFKNRLSAVVDFGTVLSGKSTALYSILKTNDNDYEYAPLVGRFESPERFETSALTFLKQQYFFNELLKSCFPESSDKWMLKELIDDDKDTLLFGVNVSSYQRGLLLEVDGNVTFKVYIDVENVHVESIETNEEEVEMFISEAGTKILRSTFCVPALVHFCACQVNTKFGKNKKLRKE